MLEPIHLEYVITPPATRDVAEFFLLLDSIDPGKRDELLTPLYWLYEVPYPEDKKKSERRLEQYEAFKAMLPSKTDHLKEKQYVVYGLVCIVLVEAARRSDIARFERIIGDKRGMIDDVRREMVKEEMPAGPIWQDIRQLLDDIATLHKEHEQSRQAYRSFCESVVQPLLGKA